MTAKYTQHNSQFSGGGGGGGGVIPVPSLNPLQSHKTRNYHAYIQSRTSRQMTAKYTQHSSQFSGGGGGGNPGPFTEPPSKSQNKKLPCLYIPPQKLATPITSQSRPYLPIYAHPELPDHRALLTMPSLQHMMPTTF